MDLLTHLELFKDAMDDYHDLLVAEAAGVGDYPYLEIGAGLRLPEKPRKNLKRIDLAIEALQNGNFRHARTRLRTIYGAWNDHVGLHDTYIDTNKMTVAHVLAHFGGHLEEEDFSYPHDETVTRILEKMRLAVLAVPLAPDAFALGVALCEALNELNEALKSKGD